MSGFRILSLLLLLGAGIGSCGSCASIGGTEGFQAGAVIFLIGAILAGVFYNLGKK